jgi:acyl carrier protein
MADIRAVVRDFLVQEVAPDEDLTDLDGSTSLIEEEILDSLGIFTLVTLLEERFAFTVEAEEVSIENFETLDAIVTLVETKLDRERR